MARRLARAAYRARQVLFALRPRLDDKGLAAAATQLTPAEARLFMAMQARDKRHAIEVLGRLRAGGVEDRELLAAALLHDCGKGQVPVWLRILKVLSPGLVRRVASAQAHGWRGAAYRLAHDAEIGARLAAGAGASETVAALIRGEVAPQDEARLALLVAADDAS